MLAMSGGGHIEARIYDVTNSVEYRHLTAQITGSDDWRTWTTFTHLDFDNESRQMKVQWKGVDEGGPSKTYYIKNAIMEFWKTDDLP
jgi:hypothetical protein